MVLEIDMMCYIGSCRDLNHDGDGDPKKC